MKNLSRNIFIGLGVVFILLLVYYFSGLVTYVLVAWVLSMIGQPLMQMFSLIRIGNWSPGASLRAALTLLTYFIIFILIIWIFVPLIAEQAANLAEVRYGDIYLALEEPIQRLFDYFRKIGIIQGEMDPHEQLQHDLSEWFQPALIGDFFGSLLTMASNFFIAFFSIVFISFFFLREEGLFTSFIVALAPTKYEDQIRHTIDEISYLLTRYFGGILIQITIITLFLTLTLSLLGVKNALLIAFFAALINVIPYLGPLIGAIFGVVITISSNLDLEFYSQMLPLLLKVVSMFVILQLIDNFFIQPFIFSNRVLAHPLEIFIVIMIGAQLNGIVGMILAIPTYTVLRVIARVFLYEFRIVQKLTNRLDSS